LAREIALLFDLQMTNADALFSKVVVTDAVPGKSIKKENAPTLNIEAPHACRRLAAGFVNASWQPSSLAIILRLCRVDCRPIDALVDLTNYVMLDYGQPMHAFDAATIYRDTITARMAQAGEQLQLLDGTTLELHPEDLVLADDKKLLSLPGIMGGGKTGVSRTTKKLCIEAGSFEPAVIRHTALRAQKRTEASMRFEKNLDPEMPIFALKRYLKLLHEQYKISPATVTLVSCGAAVKPVTIEVTHQFIEERLGLNLAESHVIELLEALDFQVFETIVDGSYEYKITVPTFRATKDVLIPEDIVEEVGRFMGYKKIPTELPAMNRTPAVAQTTYRIRALKQFCSNTLRMHEISSYAFYDESWLAHLRWQPAETLEALNPVSGNWKRLVTSLIPALLKAVHDNAEGISDLRYFEVGRRWLHLSPLVEQKQLSGVIYTRDTNVDFYTIKEYVTELCAQAQLPITWRKPKENEIAVWYDPYRVAQCVYNDVVVGTVGILAESWKERVVQTGFIGIFEVDLALLTATELPPKRYTPLPKYPDIVRDVSVLITTGVTAETIIKKIASIDPRVCAVEMVDFFKRPEWQDRISISFRYTIRDATKTLTTAEADQISKKIELALMTLGGEIR
jgi:phenylalanyl-tRNA synthetase beta chain